MHAILLPCEAMPSGLLPASAQPTNASGDASQAWKRRGADVHFYISFNTGHCGSTALGNTMSYYDSSLSDARRLGLAADGGCG